MKKWIAIIVLLFTATTLGAQLKLPALVGDNMVLQRNSTVKIWGWADTGKEVTVTTSWNNGSYTARAGQDGAWDVPVPTSDAGGPYEITISAHGGKIVLKNILLGEVWVCGGQSNMEMPMKGFIGQPVTGANEAVVQASRFPDIRLFSVKKTLSETPAADVEGKWETGSPMSVLNFSAVGYFFGRNLHETLGVPVGLIASNWGGSYIEAWMDTETLKGFEVPQDVNLRATQMYNGMIRPILNYGIAGWIWYQGESNRRIPLDYAEQMSRMVGLWRQQWDRGELPFYFVQIAPYIYGDGADGVSTALVRDQQVKALNTIPNTGMAVTLDIGDPYNIHPADKKTVGERLSYWALAKTYGLEGIGYRSPEYKSIEIKEDKAIVHFDHADLTGLYPWHVEFEGFEIAGADKQFYPAKAQVNKTGKRNSVTVWSEQVPAPVAVRYCWKNYTTGTLFNTLGLPASSFRTDDWEVQVKY